MNIPELLSPAGSEECMHAAVENGADALYFGLAPPHNFNARARAKNFPLEKLGETLEYLHRRRVKGYITLNTLVHSDELPAVESLLREVALAEADAVIIQDIGVAVLARRLCPDLPLHASTQMSLTSAGSIKQAAALGIRRVVLPRELSLKQIADLRRNTDIELECFIHGALCISYSGQCYASLGLGGGAGRSANRGNCAQPCRLPYSVLPCSVMQLSESQLSAHQLSALQLSGGRRSASKKALLSPSDFAALPVLEKLIATGVHAFKIEGRLKPPEYVAEVTRVYREAIDHYCRT